MGIQFESVNNSDSKSKLVTQICNVSNRAIICANTHSHSGFNSSPFIDWYLILQVEDNVGIGTIKKKYHKLALQLHPDKNDHSMAETAFKLLSEAYACLSDDSRRLAFDVERRNSFCLECSRSGGGKAKGIFNVERLRSNKVLKRIREIRLRFMEEARIIDECLKANSAPRKEYPCFSSSREIPVFNPSDRRGYLYLRRQSGFELGRGSCDSPIFECRSDKRKFKFGF